MLKRAIVIGASSGIGEALVERLAQRGYRVVAVARRAERLQALAERCNTSEVRVHTLAHDVTELDTVPGAFAEAVRWLDGLDTLVYAAGVMPPIEADEYNTEVDQQIVAVNITGAMAWLNEGARRLQVQGHGTLVGIGSVAGDRGRRGNPAYCASKAAIHTFLEALRNRLSQHGVHVLTIKPGPVATDMTADLGKLPMIIEVGPAAKGIVAAIESGAQQVYLPLQWGPVMAVIRRIPSVIFRRLDF